MAHKCFYILAFVFLSLACCSQVRARLVAKREHSVNSKNYQNETYHGGRIWSGIKQPIAASFPGLQENEPSKARHWAVYQAKVSKGPYYGGKAQLNVYAVPNIQTYQISSSSFWLSSGLDGPSTNLNVIQAGWQVNPSLYHDFYPHVFIYWTADGYKSTGCYDLLCKGFVVDNSAKLKPGYRITPVSEYNGSQYYITLRIQKNLDTGDWWLYRDDGDEAGPLGYWPKSLFTTLIDNAPTVVWGGFVDSSSKNDNGPPMGSGHFSSEGEGKAAYIKNIKVVNSIGDIYTAIDMVVSPYVDRQDCYSVSDYKDSNGSGGMDGYGYFLFGGPGCKN